MTEEQRAALAIPCLACQSGPGVLCTSHSGIGVRRGDVHRARLAAHAALVDSVEIALTGGCGHCDTEAIEMCAGCGQCRCHLHDTCTRPSP
ncbi:hypothetical protein [Streptomyces sp. NPDC058045]|uniref:zinc finger domain-containing protein n=1 Tax=Streptomyces sp. NPDC058045 TaxID=3346311 RepID=UPI0036ED54EF